MNRRTISSAYEPKPLVVDIDMHSLRSTLFGAKLLDVCALGGLGTGHRCYLLGGQSIILAMASTTAGSSASEGFGSFHLFHPTSILIPLGSRLFVLSLVCFGCFAFVLCVCVCVRVSCSVSFWWLLSLGYPGFREVSISSNLI